MTTTIVKVIKTEPNKNQSIIHGTHRPQDLIPAFLGELERITGASIAQINENDSSPFWDSEEAADILDTLYSELDALAPVGYYFGAHPGDGSDYGFWAIPDDDIDD